MGRLSLEKLSEIFNTFDQYPGDFSTLIETGTHLGETCINLSSNFKKIYTVEISEKYYQFAIMNFQKHNAKNVEIFLGDSSKILPQLLQILDEDLLFWLDGHWSMGDTGRGEKNCPLLEECSSIIQYCKQKKKKAILAIDDVRIFGNQTGWEDISFESIREVFRGFVVKDYVKDDIFCLLVDGNL